MADECASQVETALHRQMSADFDDLGEQFSEDELLSEVFGANYDAVCVSFATCKRKNKHEDEQYEDEQCKDRLRVSGQIPNLNHKGH